LRLCSDGHFDDTQALPGLEKLLCKAVDMADFGTVKKKLITVEARVFAEYTALLST
jgi:hypothetical protein